jgi:hypothetical protein
VEQLEQQEWELGWCSSMGKGLELQERVGTRRELKRVVDSTVVLYLQSALTIDSFSMGEYSHVTILMLH